MKWLIAVVVAVILGVAGLVVVNESGHSPSSSPGTTAKISTISTGETVDIDAHLTGGAWTVVEFTADW